MSVRPARTAFSYWRKPGLYIPVQRMRYQAKYNLNRF